MKRIPSSMVVIGGVLLGVLTYTAVNYPAILIGIIFILGIILATIEAFK